MRLEAIERGYGKYEVDVKGNSAFTWVTQPASKIVQVEKEVKTY
jgi:hypothetical protein